MLREYLKFYIFGPLLGWALSSASNIQYVEMIKLEDEKKENETNMHSLSSHCFITKGNRSLRVSVEDRWATYCQGCQKSFAHRDLQ